jgi:hypothetical protein
VWPEILLWLQNEPDSTAKSLIERLQKQYPGQFAEGHLRTLQRRIREWRGVMARTLVHACLDGKQATGNPVVVGMETNGRHEGKGARNHLGQFGCQEERRLRARRPAPPWALLVTFSNEATRGKCNCRRSVCCELL